METRPFGSTGLTVSVLGLGAGQVGDGALDDAEAGRVLNGALDQDQLDAVGARWQQVGGSFDGQV